MPRGPRGEKRPSDVIGGAVKVMRIATGEEPDDRQDVPAPSPAQQLGKLGGCLGRCPVGSREAAEVDLRIAGVARLASP